MKKSVCNTCVYAVNNNHCGLRGFRSNFNVNYCSSQNTDKLPNGFELQEDGYFSWVNKKPKNMEEKDKAKAPDLKGEDYYEKRFGYKIPNGYEFDCIKNNEIIIKPIKPKYPKTFEECLNILYCKSVLRTIIGHKAELLFNLEKLLICRDAYWKIYGEEIGLDKPWEPDRTSGKPFYCISVSGNIIGKGRWYVDNKILAFPTEEMRDTFYKNFKDLIESCKELL